jgi:1-acyl-sn-glycerol-3-phosphate acyltransferase
MLRALWRGPLLAVLIAAFLASGAAVRLLSPARSRRGRQARLTGFFARQALALLGVRVVRAGRPMARGGLLVANHLSYLDILVWASLRPVLFVTSMEVGADPFLGLLARLGGSEFVERRRPSGLRGEIDRLSRRLSDGNTVMLFPEGTSTDGSRILPFKAGLMESALRAGVLIQPACLRVVAVGGRPFVPGADDRWCWHGRMRFLPHLLRVLSTSSFEVSARFLPLLRPSEEASRKDAAEAAHFFVALAYEAGRCADPAAGGPAPSACAEAGTGAA